MSFKYERKDYSDTVSGKHAESLSKDATRNNLLIKLGKVSDSEAFNTRVVNKSVRNFNYEDELSWLENN